MERVSKDKYWDFSDFQRPPGLFDKVVAKGAKRKNEDHHSTVEKPGIKTKLVPGYRLSCLQHADDG